MIFANLVTCSKEVVVILLFESFTSFKDSNDVV
jgi:hypothetical protein